MIRKALFFLFCIIFFGCCSRAEKTGNDHLFLLVGSYSDGTTSGISVYNFNIQTGDYTYVSDIKQIENPSYLVVSQDEEMIYSVNETREGGVSAFRFDKAKGALQLVNSQPAEGAHPCYIHMDKEGKFIVTSNYTGGNISVFPLDSDRSIKPLSMNINMNAPDLPASRMHTVVFSPDEKRLLATDLGQDHIYLFEVRQDAGDQFLAPAPEITLKLEQGSGPRHLAFHPNGKYLYCINELSGKVAVFAYNEHKPEAIQYIVSDTTQTSARKGSADIHLTSDGRFLYSSNRLRADGIAVFSVNPENGRLTAVGYQLTGVHPRNFVITPNDRFLLCANRDTNNVQIFEIDAATGLLRDTGKEIALDKPVCLKWIQK
jgi:6-phosphogluconolactonase (cycloisomerase 2 family)